MIPSAFIVAGAILIAGYIIAQALGTGLGRIADRIDNNSRLVDRIGDKLDSLWSPLKDISNAAWHAQGGAPKLSELEPDDLA